MLKTDSHLISLDSGDRVSGRVFSVPSPVVRPGPNRASDQPWLTDRLD